MKNLCLSWLFCGLLMASWASRALADDEQWPSVTTPAGSLAIVKVEVGERFPPGCGDPGPLCHAVESGYKVLTVWLETEGDPSEASDYLMDLKGIYVLSGHGNRTNQFAGGMTESGLFIAFTPPESDAGFVLHWAENPPLTLGQ